MKAFRFPPRCLLLIPLFAITALVVSLNAQDFPNADSFGGFGFGDPAPGPSGGSTPNLSVSIGGEVRAELKVFHDELGSPDELKKNRPGDIFFGSLNFTASGGSAQSVINLNLVPDFDGSSPVELDEAYVRAFFGPVTVEGGVRKLTWGKADSFGPLDVVNPLDYRDLTKLSDPQSIKISRPMIRTVWSLGAFSKLEAVFVPWFEGHKFDTSGRWMPGQVKTLQTFGIDAVDYLDTRIRTLEYFQAGTRFTTSIGSSDIGFQYYYGRLPRPAVNFYLAAYYPVPEINYNAYHQIGMDFARVIAGFNLRAEAGANITEDTDGTDGAIENPSLVWSLGFDRNLVWGIKINLQGAGRIRLFQDKLGGYMVVQGVPLPPIPTDCEAGSGLSSTRITGIVSRKFFNDEFELKASCLWGIEDKDFLIMPGLIWRRNGAGAELYVGFFGGDREGELGQYHDNGFIRMILSYTF